VNTQELLKALREAGADGEVIVVPFVRQGSGPGGTATYITRESRRWVVGFTERGEWTPRKSFDTEDEACQWVYDHHTRPRPEPRQLTPEEWEEGREIGRQQAAKYEQTLAERAGKAQERDESDGYDVPVDATTTKHGTVSIWRRLLRRRDRD
jgi:hypothetical protein